MSGIPRTYDFNQLANDVQRNRSKTTIINDEPLQIKRRKDAVRRQVANEIIKKKKEDKIKMEEAVLKDKYEKILEEKVKADPAIERRTIENINARERKLLEDPTALKSYQESQKPIFDETQRQKLQGIGRSQIEQYLERLNTTPAAFVKKITSSLGGRGLDAGEDNIDNVTRYLAANNMEFSKANVTSAVDHLDNLQVLNRKPSASGASGSAARKLEPVGLKELQKKVTAKQDAEEARKQAEYAALMNQQKLSQEKAKRLQANQLDENVTKVLKGGIVRRAVRNEKQRNAGRSLANKATDNDKVQRALNLFYTRGLDEQPLKVKRATETLKKKRTAKSKAPAAKPAAAASSSAARPPAQGSPRQPQNRNMSPQQYTKLTNKSARK